MKKKVVIVLMEDEERPDVLNVTVPSIAGCCTFGFGRDHSLAMAKEAIELCLSVNNVEIYPPEIVEIEVEAPE